MDDPHEVFRSTNPYINEGEKPGPDSPRGRLPVPHRQVWAALQDGLRNLPRVRESVIWCGEGWKWAWQYSFGDEQMAFLLPSDKGVSVVLVVNERFVNQMLEHADMRPSIRKLLTGCKTETTTRRCWTPVLDVDTARDFLLSTRALLEVIRSDP